MHVKKQINGRGGGMTTSHPPCLFFAGFAASREILFLNGIRSLYMDFA